MRLSSDFDFVARNNFIVVRLRVRLRVNRKLRTF
jgi:hypothetical protein